MIRRLSLFFAVIVLLTSCASTHVNPLLSQEPDTTLAKKEIKVLRKEANPLWEKRNEKISLFEFLVVGEKIARSSHGDEEDLIRMARASYLAGEYFSSTDQEKAHYFELSSNWSEAALARNIFFKERVLQHNLPADQALDTLNKKDAEALYWFSVALGKWAITQSLATQLKYKDRIKMMIDRVSTLRPHYFYGAVYRYNGVYYASLPGFGEDNLKKSKFNFEEALKKSPDYFANHTLYAELYAKKVDDQELRRKHLDFVVNGDPNGLRDYYPEQMLEKERAKQILKGMITQ